MAYGPGKQPVPVSRPNFIELCTRLTEADELVFESLWRFLGTSVDWSLTLRLFLVFPSWCGLNPAASMLGGREVMR